MATCGNLVTVITPVYNGEAFLRDCIDSVLGQSYENFEYFIVDNCSTDKSCEIAQAAADNDQRVSVIRYEEHVGPIQNWNRSLQYVGDESQYVKFVHADDWLFSNCISKMIEVADRDTSVGIVSAYRLEEDLVSLDRLPAEAPSVPASDSFIMDGRSVGRAILAERASVLGSPTSILLRAELIRNEDSFFAERYLHADKEACLRLLTNSDFGFVKQVLSYTRRHNESITSMTNRLDTRRQENLLLLQDYGPVFLTELERSAVKERELRSYYQFLAMNIGTNKGEEFWSSHRKVLEKAGEPLSRARLAGAFLRRWTNPGLALKEHLRETSGQKANDESQVQEFLAMSRTENSAGDSRVKSDANS